jgi:hypothetical protein
MGFCGMNFFSTAGSMVNPLRAVNGLGPEILFFLKKMDGLAFWRGILCAPHQNRNSKFENAAAGHPQPVMIYS